VKPGNDAVPTAAGRRRRERQECLAQGRGMAGLRAAGEKDVTGMWPGAFSM
jgi:hypothetical protein